MLARPEPACIVIADIAGYTSYLAGVELDHAQDILADLIDTVVGALRPTFRLAKLEGDAAFTYAMTETVDGSALQDTIEGCYFAFRRRLRDIGQASRCECDACIRIPRLDLKFIAHHGPVARQRIAGREELAGRDIIVAHRLLKNDIEAKLGIVAYALYSEACVAAMGLADPAAAGLVEHRETYEHVGEVGGWVRDLEAAWQGELERARIVVGRDDAMLVSEGLLPGPPAIVWDWLTSPSRRLSWQHGVTDVQESTRGGRRGTGTTNHCIHGRDAIVEEILDWRPTEHLTVRFQMPIPGAPKLLMSDVLEPAEGGTLVSVRIARPRSARDRAILERLAPMLEESFEHGRDTLVGLVAADVAARAAAAPLAEPALPVSAGRNLAEPIAR